MFAIIREDPKAPCLSVALPRTDTAASQDPLQLEVERGL